MNTGKNLVDLHQVLNNEIHNPQQDDISYRIYAGGQGYIPKPFYSYIPKPTDPYGRAGTFGPNGKLMAGHFFPKEKKEDRTDYNHTTHNEPIGWTPGEKMIKKSELGVEDNYFFFDSFLKEATSIPSQGLYVFDLQQINFGFPIKNIIEAELYPFYVPQIEVDNTYQPVFYFFNKIYLFIENIGAEQYATGVDKSADYHFELETRNNVGDTIRFEPTNEIYTFTLPVRDLQEVRFRFKTSLRIIPFSEDCFDATAVNPPVGGPNGDRLLEFSKPHGLTLGNTYAVYIRGYDSADGAFNNIINDQIGHIATAETTTRIALATTPDAQKISSVLTAQGTLPMARVCIGFRRIAFQMRFRCLRPEITNFISP